LTALMKPEISEKITPKTFHENPQSGN